VYVAPPDRHLLLEHDRIRVIRGPKENRHRPSVDVLFRSAAWSFGPRVVGIVLSGMLDDGAAGLWAIKTCRGIAIVQDPGDAQYSDMPRSALANFDVDYCLPADGIAAALVRLTLEELPHRSDFEPAERLKLESDMARFGSRYEE